MRGDECKYECKPVPTCDIEGKVETVEESGIPGTDCKKPEDEAKIPTCEKKTEGCPLCVISSW